jgi:hypothetical protein
VWSNFDLAIRQFAKAIINETIADNSPVLFSPCLIVIHGAVAQTYFHAGRRGQLMQFGVLPVLFCSLIIVSSYISKQLGISLFSHQIVKD